MSLFNPTEFLKGLLVFGVPYGGGGGSAVTAKQVQESAFNAKAATGVNDAFIVNLNPPVTALTDSLLVTMSSGSLQNLTTSPTLQINALTPVPITTYAGTIAIDDIQANGEYIFVYNAATNHFQLINPSITTADTFAVQSNAYNSAIDTGTANNYIATLNPPPPSIVNTLSVNLIIAHTNTGASTLTVNGTSKSIVNSSGSALTAGELVVGQTAFFVYSSTYGAFILVNPANVTRLGNTVTGTGSTLVLQTNPTITTPIIAQINDTNNLPILGFTATASAVNSLNINNAITGSAPALMAIGSDTNISIIAGCKGAGFFQVNTTSNTPLKLFSGTALQHQSVFSFANTANTRTITFPDADGTVLFVAGSGGLKSFTVLTSGTAATYTKPAGITSLLVEVVGGGAAGGGAAGGAGTIAAGSGGGAGGYARLWISSALSTYTYTVGAGGLGVSGGNGGNGGTTSFGASLQATGGTGGLVMGATSGILFHSGSLGGLGSNGDINIIGGPGGTALAVSGNPASGNGGNSHYGGGAQGITGAGAGNNGSPYGAGGSGSVAGASNTAGGNGAAGVIIVWEYA